MKNPLTIDKSYTIRHKILGELHKDWEAHNHEDNRIVGSIKIASETNIPIADVHRFLHLLVEKGDIAVSQNDGQFMMSINQTGISAYVDKRYIKEGSKNKWDGIWDWARIMIPLAALILSLFNFYSNKSLNSKIKELETKIQQFKK
jgi:hypothetical protein